MKNRKITIIFIIIVIIVAILTGIYKVMTSYIFRKKDNKIGNKDTEIVEYLKEIEDNKEKKEKVKLFLEAEDITEEEAQEILEK